MNKIDIASEFLIPKGCVEVIIETKNGEITKQFIRNTVLNGGKRALARTLANEIGTSPDNYINRMLFGNGGTLNGTPRFVDAGRNGLFGVTTASKPVIGSSDPNIAGGAVFTSVLTYDDINDTTINEIGLQLKNGDLYAMITSPDFNKTSLMQITFNWKIQFI